MKLKGPYSTRFLFLWIPVAFCCSGMFSRVFSQVHSVKGLPFITNYRYQDYNADGVNWWAEEDDQGVMYFANAQGVLIFDGQHWDLVKPPGAPETRSLAKSKDGIIYVGTNGDLGYLARGKKGQLEFITLKDKLPEQHRLFAEVWETQIYRDEVYFRTNNKMFVWNGRSFRVLECQEGFHVGAEVKGRYFVRIWTRGLTELRQDSFHLVPNGEKFANERIYVMLPYDDQRLLIGSRTKGMFIYDGKDFTPFQTEADPFIVNTSLYGGRILSNGLIALNTFNDGMVIIDKQGKLIQRIDKSVGLQDNSVDQVFEDSRGILWMPLFNGIAKFDLRSSLTFYNEALGLPAKTVFSVGNHRDQIYAGTNNGIYLLNPETNRFQKVQGSSGQVGNFLVNGKDLLVSGAERGLLKLEGNKAIAVIPGINYDFHLRSILRSKLDTSVLYCALRSGLAVVRYSAANGKYTMESFAPISNPTAGLISETSDGNLWMNGDDIGKVKLVKPDRSGGHWVLQENAVEVFDESHGLPNKNITVLEYNREVYFAADQGEIYRFDQGPQRFIRDTVVILNKQFVFNADFTLLGVSDPQGRIWANFGHGVFVAIPSEGRDDKIVNAPFKELRKNYPVWDIALSTGSKGEVVAWMSGREGIIRYDGNLDESAQDRFSCILRGITLNEDSVYYAGFGTPSGKALINKGWNTVRFDYAAPFFKLEKETRFSSILEGRDKHWSEWDHQNSREFGNLAAGTYTFRVKAKNIYDTESSEAAFSFTVLPPWYGTWWAYALYALLAGVFIYAIVRWRTRQLHEKHRELELMVNERTAELKQRVDELAVINSVQDGLARELDIQGIYDLVGDRLCTLFPDSQTLVIRTFDHEKGLEHWHYAKEKGIRQIVDPRPLNWNSRQLIQTKKPLDIQEHYVETAKKYGGTGVTAGQAPKSAVFVPMMVGEVVKGSISLQNVDREHAFNESDLRLLNTLTNSMSVALENARLFDETNRLLKETEQRTAELAVINSVQDGLARELDIRGIYNLVGDRLRHLFPDTQTLVIRTFDHETGLEHFQYAVEKGEHIEVAPRPFNWANKLLIQSKKAVDIKENYVETAHKYGGTGVTAGQAPKSAVFVPMIVGEVVKGSISLQNVDRENAFSESDLRLLTTLTNSMSVALENARLFDETNRLLKETEQRTAELAVINSVQEGLAKELDMKGIYDLVGDRLCELFPDTQTLVIRTFDHDKGMEHFQYAIEKGLRLTVESQPYIWASKHLIHDRKPILINQNYLETSKKYGGTGVTKGSPPKSAVFVPMLVGDLVKGSISLQNVDREHAFSESDLRLLTTITNSMSVALENARLFDETTHLLKETEQRTAELAVINSVQDGLVREMDINAIYELVGKRLCDLFNTQTVLIRTFDHAAGMEHWRYVIEKGERHYSEPRPLIWANRYMIEHRKPILINENYLETAKKFGGSGVSMGKPPKSAVFVPMIVGEVVKGSISLQNVEMENAFSESDLRLLTTITNSMSVALENARLFDETTLLLAESKQRAAELTTVNNISRALASQLDVHDLVQMVGDQLRDLFKANIVYLALWDPKSNMIDFPYQYGEDMPSRKLGEGLTSKIIRDGQPLLINKDVDETTASLGVQPVGVSSASYLGVPIPVGDRIIGVLSVQSTEQENRFHENDLRLLTTIASSVGVALNNASLFEEVKEAQAEAEAASKLAEKANEAKSAFLSTVSHELRTPLTSVLGFAKIIKKRLEERIFPATDISDPRTEKAIQQVSENLNVVVSEGQRLTSLINDVLDLAKIEAGKMEWNQESVFLPEVAERAIAATTSLFDQKSIRLIKEIRTDLPEITGDRDKLIQVMVNLISNAVKFTPKGTVTCKVYREKDEIIVSVSDTGIGIAEKDHAAVFEQFKQVGDTLTDKPKGTGLGLPICKEIVEHHGGRIWLESELGKGSTFLFSLPVTKTKTPRPQHLDELVKQLKEQVALSPLSVDKPAAHILIVDDDDSIRSLLQQELGDAGYHIDEARNGKEALAKVREGRPDLILLDIMMPEMNGFDVAAVLKNDPQTMDIPIIVLSVVQDKARGFRIGVDRYLNKPIDTGILFNEIGNLLEQGKSKKKVMIVDEDSGTIGTLTEVLKTKGYTVLESNVLELVEKALVHQPDIIIINSLLSGNQESIQALQFEKGMENVLFLVYH